MARKRRSLIARSPLGSTSAGEGEQASPAAEPPPEPASEEQSESGAQADAEMEVSPEAKAKGEAAEEAEDAEAEGAGDAEAPAETEAAADAEAPVEAGTAGDVEVEVEMEDEAADDVEAPAEVGAAGDAEAPVEIQARAEATDAAEAAPDAEASGDADVRVEVEVEAEATTAPDEAEAAAEAPVETEAEAAAEAPVEAEAAAEAPVETEAAAEAPIEAEAAAEAPVETEAEAAAEAPVEAEAFADAETPVEAEARAPDGAPESDSEDEEPWEEPGYTAVPPEPAAPFFEDPEAIGADPNAVSPSPQAQVRDEPEYVRRGEPNPDTTEIGWSGSVHEADDEEQYDPISDFFDVGTGDGADNLDPPAHAPSGDDSGLYADPMGVPEPPRVPGIADRYTPPPAERRGQEGVEDRPGYSPTPAPDLREGRRRDLEDEFFEPEPFDWEREEPRPFGLSPAALVAVASVQVLVFLLAVWGLVSWHARRVAQEAKTQPTSEVIVQPSAPPEKAGVQVRSALRNPNAGATPDTAAPSGTLSARPAGTAGPGATTPSLAPHSASAPPPTSAPKPAPAPHATRHAARRVAPRVAPPPVARTGTLRIRSNRKVLVYVNGRVQGPAPLDLPLTPGSYSVSAALPSRPDTEQVKQVSLAAGMTQRVEFNF